MKIDVAQITDYDSLSLEEKVAALENFEYDDHSAELADLEKYKRITEGIMMRQWLANNMTDNILVIGVNIQNI